MQGTIHQPTKWIFLGWIIASILSACGLPQAQPAIPPTVQTEVPTASKFSRSTERTSPSIQASWTPTPKKTVTPTAMKILTPSDGWIAFNVSGSDHEGIYTVDAQGINLHAIITGNEIYTNPVWSQDGKTIYFLSDLRSVSGILEIYRIGVENNELRRLTFDQYYDSNLALAPDGRKLAYISGHPHGDSIQRDIYEILTQNGAALPQLTNDPLYELTLSWSPDGKMIAFLVLRENTLKFGDLYVMAVDGSNPQHLTSGLVLLSTPSWSPDGSQIVISMERNGNADLFLVNVDGSGMTRFTATGTQESHPVWSPHSQLILYEAADADGSLNIYRINSSGQEVMQLTDEPRHANDISYQSIWSPDGQHIAYVTQSERGQAELYIMNADGTGKTLLVGNLGKTIDDLNWVIPNEP